MRAHGITNDGYTREVVMYNIDGRKQTYKMVPLELLYVDDIKKQRECLNNRLNNYGFK